MHRNEKSEEALPPVDYNAYRVPPDGTFTLAASDPADTGGWKNNKEAQRALKACNRTLSRWQERLYAEGKQSLLLVLQAMDTGGKDSTIRSVMSGVNPQGCRIFSFKAPTRHELDRDFLWRVHQRVPPRGHIGIFNRSHYEDVLIVRVHGWADRDLIEKRYDHINAFEALLTDHGTRIIKVFLHISKAYQLERFRKRLKRPDKWWKFNPSDLEERRYWEDYMIAYEAVLNRCSTTRAPWYVVPAEKRWFRNLVISKLLVDTLREMNPAFPPPSFDPAEFAPDDIR